MLIVSWNCRGLGNPNKAEVVKDLLRMDSTDILSLQEIKNEEKLSSPQAEQSGK